MLSSFRRRRNVLGWCLVLLIGSSEAVRVRRRTTKERIEMLSNSNGADTVEVVTWTYTDRDTRETIEMKQTRAAYEDYW